MKFDTGGYARIMVLFRAAVFCAVLLCPAMSSGELSHATIEVFSAYPGRIDPQTGMQAGYSGTSPRTPVYPGVLHISPGENWSNFLGAAADRVPYTVHSVTLKRIRPASATCSSSFPSGTLTQNNTVRLRWPLLYEPAGTRWELTIIYFTSVPYDDDGTGPNPPGTVHTEKWTWLLASDTRCVRLVLQLLRETDSSGKGSPALSDIAASLLIPLSQQALTSEESGDSAAQRSALQQIAQALASGCASGGVVQSSEHPACCKLQTEVAYVLSRLPVAHPREGER